MALDTDLLDVVIPTYNARELVLGCLKSLEDPIVAQRIVVDDVSEDDTVEAIRDRAPDVEIVELTEHRGLAHALNAGAARGDAPYVLFLNNDVFATAGAVASLAEALDSAPLAASASGRLIDYETGATQ